MKGKGGGKSKFTIFVTKFNLKLTQKSLLSHFILCLKKIKKVSPKNTYFKIIEILRLFEYQNLYI